MISKTRSIPHEDREDLAVVASERLVELGTFLAQRLQSIVRTPVVIGSGCDSEIDEAFATCRSLAVVAGPGIENLRSFCPN